MRPASRCARSCGSAAANGKITNTNGLAEEAPAGVRRSLIILATLAAFFLNASDRRPPGETALPTAPGAVLQQLVSSGQTAPVGGSFDRFELAGQAIPAPSNRNGAVAFFASLIRSEADEGLFIAVGDHIGKISAVGDVIPSGERIADFTERPNLALNAAGAVAFVASLAGGR